MEIIKHLLPESAIVKTKTVKENIILHHTGGLDPIIAIEWWKKDPQPVGTHYVIGRDGKIYQAMEEDRWAYHLGVNGDDNYYEYSSVSIEICAYGFLYKEKEEFAAYPLYPKKIPRRLVDKSEVWKIDWQGMQYYQTYTQSQIDSLIWLINDIRVRNKITLQPDLKTKNNWFTYQPELLKRKTKLKGLFSHTTFNKQKSDIVPEPSFLSTLYQGLHF